MAEESYRIVFRGELVEGVSRAEAEANLKSRFKYSDSALSKLFAGKGVILKSGLDQATAAKYEKALAGVGLVCEVSSPALTEVPEPVTPTPVAAAEPEPQEQVAQGEEAPAEPEPEPPVEAVAVDYSDSFAEPASPVEAVAVDDSDPFAEAEPAAAETIPVQESVEEPVVSSQPEAADVPEDIFATTEAEPEPVQEEAAVAVASELAVAADAEESVFETESTVAAASEDSFFDETAAAAGGVSDVVLYTLKQTKPWVRLISVLLFVSSGLGLLAIAGIFIASTMGGLRVPSDTPTLMMLVFQMFSLLLYLIPAYFLFKYASAIGALLKGGGESELITALGYQKSFWRFSGILALIFLVLAVLGILAAVLLPTLMG